MTQGKASGSTADKVVPKQEKKTTESKYERAAQKNLGIFMKAIGGHDDVGESDDLYDHTSAGEEEEASEQEEEEVEQVPTTKKRRISHSNATVSKSKATFKSKEFISDSDDSSNETAPQQVASTSKSTSTSIANAQAVPNKRKSTVVSEFEESDEDVTAKAKGKGKGKEKKSKEVKDKKPRKAPAAKPLAGDASKGSDFEETRIKKLKTLLAAAGLTRPFTPSTGAERTLLPSSRLALFTGLLTELGLMTSASTLPSLAMCKEVGERRALEREMKELSGVPLISGLRGGKQLSKAKTKKSVIGDSDEEEEKKVEKKSKGRVSTKAFAAFLGDQGGSDSE